MVDVPKKVCYNSLVPGSISVAGHDILLRLVLVPAHAATLDKNGKIFMGILPSEVLTFVTTTFEIWKQVLDAR